jgi:hypothetical protein
MELSIFFMRSISSTKKEEKNEVFCSFNKKSILDLMDPPPPSPDKDVKDLLSFSIPNIFPSILFTNPFLMEF